MGLIMTYQMAQVLEPLFHWSLENFLVLAFGLCACGVQTVVVGQHEMGRAIQVQVDLKGASVQELMIAQARRSSCKDRESVSRGPCEHDRCD